MKNSAKTIELFEFDKGFGVLVGGCDEAGRGPLAGPVVCAACVMPMDEIIDKINDSKKVSEKVREALYEAIKEKAISYSVSIIDRDEIDEINILNATKKGMTEAINGLKVKPNLMLVDAVKLDCDMKTLPLIKGDAKSYNIAAASIIAKVTRDRIMRDLDEKYPEYGFAAHKGYGTAKHIEALKTYGATLCHRKTFIKNFISEDFGE